MTDFDIELVYFSGCPNVDDARATIQAAFVASGRVPRLKEWNLDDDGTPERVRGFASPTIFIGGDNLTGDQPMAPDGRACSISGIPTVSTIVSALADLS